MSTLLDSRLNPDQLADALAHDPPAQPSRADALAQEVGRLKRELDQFRSEYLGKGQRPQSGCKFATVSLEEAEVLVEYEFRPEQEPIYDVESPGVGPGCPASLTVLQMLVNGRWIDPRDVLREEIVARWEEQLLCES